MFSFKCVFEQELWEHDRNVMEHYKGSLGGETSVLRTFRMSGKELVKERVSKERVSQRNS